MAARLDRPDWRRRGLLVVVGVAVMAAVGYASFGPEAPCNLRVEGYHINRPDTGPVRSRGEVEAQLHDYVIGWISDNTYKRENPPDPSVFIVGRSRIAALPGHVFAAHARPGWRPGRVAQFVARTSQTDNPSDDCTERAVAEARRWILRGGHVPPPPVPRRPG